MMQLMWAPWQDWDYVDSHDLACCHPQFSHLDTPFLNRCFLEN